MDHLSIAYKSALAGLVIHNWIISKKGFINERFMDISKSMELMSLSGTILPLYTETMVPMIEKSIYSEGGSRFFYNGEESDIEYLLLESNVNLVSVLEGLKSFSMYNYGKYIENKVGFFGKRKMANATKNHKMEYEQVINENDFHRIIEFSNKLISPT